MSDPNEKKWTFLDALLNTNSAWNEPEDEEEDESDDEDESDE